MNTTPRRLSLAALLLPLAAPAFLPAQFVPPTPAELAMKSIPQVPNAPAVYLFREETTEDRLRMFSYYVRLKVLTEGGKDYANVELPFTSNGGGSIDSIQGRTIQPDGTVVPFTGKPYEKLVEKGQGFSVKTKVFTLPQVQVGSIIEYRYKFRYDDAYFQSPQWYIQSPLYTIKAHYRWLPTSSTVVTSDERGDILSSVAWTPILPAGAKVVQTELMNRSTVGDFGNSGGTQLDLTVQDIPPLPQENFMPPVNSLSYRVLFYYTSYKSAAEFWSKEGKRWSKTRDKFMTPGPAVTAAVNSLVAPGDPAEVKLKKIYDSVMQLENTDYTRGHSEQEERAQGLKMAATADDILARKRGSGDQLAELFVTMVRAAGMKAYLMGVSDRSRRFFLPAYVSLSQLDDYIAIVPVDGKDVFFDPGTRFCAFKHLAWQHTLSNGLRQADEGPKLSATPGELFTASQTKRVADLSLDEQGIATGTVSITYTGDPALRWRHQALRGDDTSLNNDLRSNLEHELPGGMEIRVTSTENLADGDKPLVVKYDVKGAIGSPTGKRLLIGSSLFESNSKPEFTETKRELAVDMHYPEAIQDAVRVKYPASLTVESVPPAESEKMGNVAGFSYSSKESPHAITMFRNLTIGKTYFTAGEYPELRTFYGKLDSKQAETLILTHGDGSAKPSAAGGN